jgi:GTP cyclohydrolase II
MFSYVDPSIYELLLDQGKIVTIGEDGRPSENGIRPGTDRIHLLGPIPLPTTVEGREHVFRWYPFVRRTQHEQVLEIARRLHGTPDMNGLRDLLTAQMTVSSILVHGDFEAEAFRRIVDEGCGAIVYMAGHEGRGIGLWAKGITYLLQDMGRDTYDANRDLNLPPDSRDFRDAAYVLLHFLRPPPRIRLLSNNPLKRDDLTSRGIEIVGLERLVVGLSDHNLRYMHAKRTYGHATGELPPAHGEDDPDG